MKQQKPNQIKKLSKKAQAEEKAKKQAFVRSSGVYNAVSTILSLYRSENIDVDVLRDNLSVQWEEVVKKGDTSRMETIMMTQAQTLNCLFHFAAARISCAERLPQLSAYTDIAMKANNACRKSLLALSQIKNPAKATFIKQQNNAVNQQVNNGVSAAENLKNSEKNSTNELLSEVTHEKLDIRSES